MASKEEICSRVAFEASKVYASYDGRHPSIPEQEAMAVAVRPSVERMIELEDENTELRDRLNGFAPKLAQAERIALEAEARGDDLAASLHNMTSKLAQAEQRVIEQGRTIEVLNVDRSRVLADLTEARAGWRTAEREHDETTAALRAQIAALSGVIDGHEQAIRDACADVRAGMYDQSARSAAAVEVAESSLDKANARIAALETTVDVLAGRLAQRGGGS